jgi:hypothetical protein
MQSTLAATQVRLNKITTSLDITVNSVQILSNAIGVSGLEAIGNTTKSLLNAVRVKIFNKFSIIVILNSPC